MNRKRLEIFAVVVAFVIGYAGVGFVVSAARVANADRTLNSVVSHENTLNARIGDVDSQLSALSGSSAFNPQQATVLADKYVSDNQLAIKTINDDRLSIDAASAQLTAEGWLTMIEKNSLDREATRLGHGRAALDAANTIAADKVEDGRFWHALYASLSDLTVLESQSGANDLAGAKTTLETMKTDVDSAVQLSVGPGLPPELHSLVTDLQGFVGDYGQQLDARIAGDDAGVTTLQATITADLGKVAGYDIDKIGSEIDAFYRPLIDRFNTEIAAATA